MPLTLEDIAQLSGFSKSTVSRVINGDPNVSALTRERIMEVVNKYNFQPNMAARGLAAGKTRVLGLVVPQGIGVIFNDPFFSLLIQGVSSACNASDYSVMLWLAEPEYERQMISKILYNGIVDGIIVSSMLSNDPIITALSQGRLPFLIIGRHPTNPSVNTIDVDNPNGARMAVRHLALTGHKRIATITGPLSMAVGADRYQGYLEGIQEQKLFTGSELVAEGDFTENSGYLAMQKLLPQQPDAVFVASDPMATGAMRAILEAGLTIPQDIAIVGFDDNPQACHTLPKLTTVRQPTQKLGMLAAETLMDIIQNPSDLARNIILPTELVIRESCGSRPAADSIR